ncbi:neurofilament medium polypeptide-like isoform X2 [Xenopus tropicalis]|uniref:Neurofilament medium polypeptide-like isoform X2 n=1 Tax=Xenopus tropicalis TaxID=8364 RepID=A0A8J1JKE3_XENTR|nr:neurofilament medium polypeptide-like isoform X2 [Xenopus tropicalis]
MAAMEDLLRGCETIRQNPRLQELFRALDTFRPENTDFPAMISYYEHHYRYFFGEMEDLEHFLCWYALNHIDEGNLTNYLVMIKHLEEMELVVGIYYAFYNLAFRAPRTQEGRLLRSQLEAFLILYKAVKSKLEEVRTQLVGREEPQELPGTSQQQLPTAPETPAAELEAAEEEDQETPAAELEAAEEEEEDQETPAAELEAAEEEEEDQETPAAELEAAEEEDQETPAAELEAAEEGAEETPAAAVVVEQLALTKRVRKAITRQFQRIWVIYLLIYNLLPICRCHI